jgi:hypothetical protein
VIKCDAITQKSDKKVINMWTFFVITLYAIGVQSKKKCKVPPDRKSMVGLMRLLNFSMISIIHVAIYSDLGSDIK